MDTHLNDDMVKLVNYSIVTIERDAERVLVSQEEEIFDDSMSDDAFSSWVISKHPSTQHLRPEARKYLRVSYEVMGRWAKQDRKYEKRQLEVLGEIRNAIANRNPFSKVAKRLDQNADRLRTLRQGFKDQAEGLGKDVAGVLGKYRVPGEFKAKEVKASDLSAAFALGLDAPFDDGGLESFAGRWKGVNKRYSFETSEEMPPDEAPWHMTWGQGSRKGDEYVQTVVGSQLRHYTDDALPPLDENKVDLALNVYRPDIGITGWLTTRVQFRQELALISYELDPGHFLWIGQVLTPELEPVMGPNIFWMFQEWIVKGPKKSYYMYGIMFSIDFENGKATAFGDSFRKSRFSWVK